MLAREYERATTTKLQRHHLKDRWHSQVLVLCGADGYHLVPSVESFSRISGVCQILGDKHSASRPPQGMEVGDFIRIGSVGLVVTELCALGQEPQRIIEGQLMYLKRRILEQLSMGVDEQDFGEVTLPCNKPSPGSSGRHRKRAPRRGDEGSGSMDMESDEETECSASADTETSGDEAGADICYICCDETVTPQNPLVSACKCKGGTKWLHLDCLRKLLYQASEEHTCVVSTLSNDHICKVCRYEYRKHFRLEDGTVQDVEHPRPRPPYICLKVVTHNAHSRADGSIFNASFQISFASVLAPGTSTPVRPLYIGRSHESDVELQYQTVSGRHAALSYANGVFSIQDLRSSNGTFLYLRKPLRIPVGSTTRIRMGRKTVSFTCQGVPRWGGAGGTGLLRRPSDTSTGALSGAATEMQGPQQVTQARDEVGVSRSEPRLRPVGPHSPCVVVLLQAHQEEDVDFAHSEVPTMDPATYQQLLCDLMHRASVVSDHQK